MKLFLTGYTGGFGKINGERVACEFNRHNGFFDMLRDKLPPTIKCLMLASSPAGYEYNDVVLSNLTDGFKLDGFTAECVVMCDNRNAEAIMPCIHDYNVLYLCGGHVPTQVEFFNRINLKAHIAGYNGVIIGRSAGSMSCADAA